MILKVCGMRNEKNLSDLIKIQPDFIGLIFHEKSPRNVLENIEIDFHENIIPTGVFVEKSEAFILHKIADYKLKAIQLHGYESPQFCKKIQSTGQIIIKAFNIHDSFDFSTTTPYQGACNYFLFDAFGKKAGGNGTTFNWKLLNEYKGETPFLLSGGIDETMANDIKKIKHPQFAGIDINSGFEIEPALKNIEKIKHFSNELRS